MDSRNLRLDYGLADLDRTHAVTANYVWQIPFFETAGVGRRPCYAIGSSAG